MQKFTIDRQHYAHGSVTIFFALLFPVLLALVVCSIASVQIEAGSAETACVVDESLFTLFSRYDQPLFEKYDLFYLDGSCGTGTMAIHEAAGFTGKCMDELFSQNNSILYGSSLLHLKRRETSVSGYMLMTDAGGASFESQAIASAGESLGTGLLAGLQKMFYAAESPGTTSSSLTAAEKITSEELLTPEADSVPADDAAADQKPVQDVYNPIPVFEALKAQSVLPLVAEQEKIPSGVVSLATLPSHRPLNKGFGTMRIDGRAVSTDRKILYHQYLVRHFSNFLKPSASTGLSCQTEYIVAGRGTDRDNLEAVVRKMIRLRQLANFSYLMGDAEKQAELTEMAAILTSAFYLPGAEEACRLLLAAGWSYVESLIDVRDLLDGKICPLGKTAATWQVGLDEIAAALADPASFEKGASSGMNYQDYLCLLLGKAPEGITMRAIDMVEAEMRSSGRSWFCADCLFDSVDLHVETVAEKAVPITYEAHFDYRNLS